MNDINWTGERLETFVFNENTIEHLHRYAITLPYIRGKDVLDIASGEGYGSNIMAQFAKNVIGVDIDEKSVLASKNKYTKKNLNFFVGSALSIPLESSSVDVVVSFETIEHLDQHEEMLHEIKRVLRKDGVLLMSSPDKRYYSDLRNYINPYHIKELYFHDFKKLIKKHFKSAEFFFQNIFRGSIIVPENTSPGFKSFEGDYTQIKSSNKFSPLYNICIASDIPLTSLELSVFDGAWLDTKKTKEIEIASQRSISKIKNSWSYRIGNFILKPLQLLRWYK